MSTKPAAAHAREEVVHLTAKLKQIGVLPYTVQEFVELELDKLFPNAASGVTADLAGKRYVKSLTPRSRSRSGRTVYTLDSRWACVGEVVPPNAEPMAAAAAAEEINRKLDELYPNARSRDVVEHEGKKYQKRFAPDTMSSTGRTVRKWLTWWEPH